MNRKEIENLNNKNEFGRIIRKKLMALGIAGSIGVTAASVFTGVSKSFSKSDSVEESISKKDLKELEKKCNSIVNAFKNQEDIDNAINQLVFFIDSNDALGFKQQNLDINSNENVDKANDFPIIG